MTEDAQTLMAALRNAGVTLTLTATTGKLAIDAPRGALTNELRDAVQAQKDGLAALLPMPSGGWPCRGGCSRQSLLTADQSRYWCWSCAFTQRQRAAASNTLETTVPPYPYSWPRTPMKRQCMGCGEAIAGFERHYYHEVDNTNWHPVCGAARVLELVNP